MRDLARSPHVFCKVPGMITEAVRANWKPSDFKAYLDVVFEAFGEDRLMYGSDWPVCLLAGRYEQVLGLVDGFTRQSGPTGREKTFGDHAARFSGVPRTRDASPAQQGPPP